MRKLILASLLLALIAVIATARPTNAQQGTCPDGTYPYWVVRGDSLWSKGGAGWEAKLAVLTEHNPQLAGRQILRYSPDHVFFLLKKGEPICNMEESGFEVRHNTTIDKPATPMQVGTIPLPAATPIPGIISGDPALNSVPWQLWAALIITTLLMALAMFRLWYERRRRAQERQQEAMRHPVTLGPPMVPGGIAHLDINAVGALMDERFREEYINGTRIQGPDRVRLLGRWGFGFGDNISREGICEGREEDRAYRSVYQRPSGATFERFTLIWCGNDARTATSLGGRWVFDPLPAAPVAPPPPSPRPRFGFAEASRYAAVPGTTDGQCQRHMLLMEQMGADNTLLADIERYREGNRAHVREFDAEADRCRAKVAALLLQIERLHLQAEIAADQAHQHRLSILNNDRLRARFFPVLRPEAVLAPTLTTKVPEDGPSGVVPTELITGDGPKGKGSQRLV